MFECIFLEHLGCFQLYGARNNRAMTGTYWLHRCMTDFYMECSEKGVLNTEGRLAKESNDQPEDVYLIFLELVNVD